MYVVEKCKQKSGPPPRKAYRINSLTKENWKLKKQRRHRRRRSSSMSLSNKISKAGGVPQFTADEKVFNRDDRKFITSAPQIAISRFHFFSKRERERDLKRIIHINRKNNKKPLTLTLHVPCLGHFPVRGLLAAVWTKRLLEIPSLRWGSLLVDSW